MCCQVGSQAPRALSLSPLVHDYIGAVGRMSLEELPGDGAARAAIGDGEDGRGELASTGPASGARPLVLPEVFDGSSSWSDWRFHFENVATVNGWDDTQKLRWLRVRMTGRAQKALLRLPGATADSYDATRDALRARFEPESRHTRYQAEFQLRRKKAAEGWADFGDDLRNLADKAYPDLQEEARERLSINTYLDQLPQPQLSFAVRQKQPATLDEAVAATLEMESYLAPCGAASIGQAEVDSVDKVDTGDKVAQLTDVVGKLVERVERLQLQVAGASQSALRAPEGGQETTEGVCWGVLELSTAGPHGPEVPLTPPTKPGPAGKLNTPGAVDRASGGETEKVHHSVQISPIIGGYRIPGSIQGTSVTLLLDTGAAVTLLRHDVWMGITAQPSDLKPWSGATLVSAGGEPLTTHGCTCLPLKLGGRTLEIEFVVASPLTSEAILGVDFLQAQQATIDMGEGVLHLKKSSCDIALDPPPLGQPLAVARPVRSSYTVEVPPRSVMEITACIDGDVEGVWLVEALDKDMHVAVARAVVEPTSNTLPVRILNTSDQPATLYAGSAVATMTPVDPPWEVGAVNKGGEGFRVDQEKQQVLQQLVWDGCTELTSGEKEIFLELLLKYADLLAFSTADLGRTSKLRHKIDTGGAPPIRQPVRRISPPQR